jgi:ribosomal-protein-alanine N-acetyltransferase
VIRKYRPEDLPSIMEIEAEAFPKTAYDETIFITWSQGLPETFLIHMDEPSRRIVGYIMFWPDGHIASVAVAPDFRRKGIGTRLVERSVQMCNGIAKIEVRKSNEVAIEFYKNLGFVQIGIVPDYYPEEDAIVMVKLDRE